MIRFLAIFLCLVSFASAQEHPDETYGEPCNDRFEISDRGANAAQLYYLNAGRIGPDGFLHGCTGVVPDVLTSHNGITISIKVFFGGVEHDNAERITITPVTPEYIATPSEAWVLDGDEITILISRPFS